jgi:hypothetical protein
MKKLAILSSFAVLGAVTLAFITDQPAISSSGWGDITCNPKSWTCLPDGHLTPPSMTVKPATNRTLISSLPSDGIVFIGKVRNNTGYLTRMAGKNISDVGNATWRTCPQNTQLLGLDFQPNGFWLCASPKLAQGTWYFGNVVNNRGYYWEISGGKAKAVGDVKWDTCWSGSLLARQFSSDGFWVCSPH